MRLIHIATPALAGLIGMLLSACSAGVEGETGDFATEDGAGETMQSVLTNCASGQLNSGFMTHTCNHALMGPWYGTRAATTSTATSPWFGRTASDTTTGDPLPTAGESGYPHIYYTVTLPSIGGGLYEGKMKFKTGSVYGAGDYAIVWKDVTGITVKQGATTINRDSNITANPGVMSCTGFTGYNVYPLTASVTTQYDITITSNVSSVKILFERMADHRRRLYKDIDGDGWGLSADSLLSECVPTAPYTATSGSDCNDANASINPVAPETCGDGKDSNCNGNECT